MSSTGEGFVLGVDLGTSHTVAVLSRPDGRTRPLLFDGRPLLPSAVYLDTTGRLHVGQDALRLGYAEPGRLEPNPKRHVDDGSVLLGGDNVAVVDLLAALLGAVAQEAVATAGFLPPAVLTFPASWGAPRRAVLTEALAKAGWPASTRLVPEPVAAARYFAEVLRRPIPVGSSLAVFDFGGGTLDIAVVRNDGPGPDGRPVYAVTASGGADDLGGLDLDSALVDHLGKSLAGAEPEAWQTLTEPVTLAQWRARRQFWQDVRGAKEMLSRSAFAPVPVPGVEHAVHLTREELEAAADPLVRRGVDEAGAVIRAGGLEPADLAGLFLVGGSSRVPLVARLLHGELGVAPTVLEQPELPVAEGATLALSTSAAPAPAPAAGPPKGVTAPGIPAPGASGPGTSGPGSSGSEASGPEASGKGGAEPVRFVQGVAEAATPTPTPATAQESPIPITDTRAESPPVTPPPVVLPPAVAASGPDDRHYADPVDPWATGEAAAIAAGGHTPFPGSPAPFGANGTSAFPQKPGSGAPGSGAPGSGAPGSGTPGSGTPGSGTLTGVSWLASSLDEAERLSARRGRGRRSYKIIVAAAVTVVLAVSAVGVWYFWPGYPALDYHPLSEPRRITAMIPVGTAWSDAEVIDDRAYFASADTDTGRVGVVAVDTGATKPAWQSDKAGAADRWSMMIALPTGVVLFSDTSSSTGKRRMVVLGADKGERLWERTIGSDDEVYFVGDVAVLIDRVEQRLLGLGLSDGKTRWTNDDPKTTVGVTVNVRVASTPKDLAGPATVSGRPLSPVRDDDNRIVQISADRSARVYDAESGDLITSAQNIADTTDELIAHNGRLLVRESEGTHRIVSYDLGKLVNPKILYTAQPGNELSHLAACGDDRICFVEEKGYDAKSAQVVAVDAAKGGRLWEHSVPGAERLVPVGESVLAGTTTDTTTLLDPDGRQVWTNDWTAARLDGDNVLTFSKRLSSYPDDPAMTGQHLGDSRVELGPLQKIRSETCSWNTSVLACAGDTDFVLQDFAG
ncbi:Hsp70 family protein [Micromonosporaceae bacterium Da 78-11]